MTLLKSLKLKISLFDTNNRSVKNIYQIFYTKSKFGKQNTILSIIICESVFKFINLYSHIQFDGISSSVF